MGFPTISHVAIDLVPETRTPTQIAEDAVREIVDRLTPFQRATAYWLLNCEGMSRDRALEIRRRGVEAKG